MDDAALIALITKIIDDKLGTPLEPIPEPVIDPETEMDTSGVFFGAIESLGLAYQYIGFVSNLLAGVDNRPTKSDVYRFAAAVIQSGIASNEFWIADSVASWRYAYEGMLTRASEIDGDARTTEVLPFVSHVQAMSTVDYGITEHTANMLSLLMRRVSGQFQAQLGDRDLGPNGEKLTPGECLRLVYAVLDFLIDSRIVPTAKDSAFSVVRLEVYNQYKAMGEGVFGPMVLPGGSQPWSWAGGR